MFSSVLQEATGLVDRQFLKNLFFPSLIFWGLLIAIGVAGERNLSQVSAEWEAQATFVTLLQIIGFVAWVMFFSGVLSSQLTRILRFYEGYWTFPFSSRLKAAGQKWHQAQLAAIAEDTDRDQERYLYYPPKTRPHEVMPTRLGNILKNAELYPRMRYGIDAVLVWPRLYNVLPDRFVQLFLEARSGLDFMLVLTTLSGAFAVLSGLYLLIVGATWWLFLVCFLGGLLVARLAYQGALGSAVAYAEQIKVAFDLYRNELLKQMRLPLPSTPEEEKSQWSDIDLFLLRNVRQQPDMWKYMGEAADSSSKKE